MTNLIIELVVGIVIFVVGAGVGAHNAATVTNAITVIKAAEQKAQATLAQITAHKAS